MDDVAGTAGIDVGATLCKLALRRDGWETATCPSSDLDAARAVVERWRPARVVATGGGADALGDTVAGVAVAHVSEFEAWARGAPLLAREEGLDLPARYLLVSLGTGTSVLSLDDGRVGRVGGTALGGGTVMGLGRLLLGVESFAELAALAQRGDRRTVDLLVGDVYRGDGAPLLRDLTAASFAKLEQNTELNLDLRVLAGAGIGRYFLRTNRNVLSAMAALDVTRENYIDATESKTNMEAVLGANFDAFRYWFPNMSLTSSLFAYPSLTEKGRVRISFQMNIRYEVFRRFYVSLGFTDSYDSKPGGETTTKNDYSLTFGISWSLT